MLEFLRVFRFWGYFAYHESIILDFAYQDFSGELRACFPGICILFKITGFWNHFFHFYRLHRFKINWFTVKKKNLWPFWYKTCWLTVSYCMNCVPTVLCWPLYFHTFLFFCSHGTVVSCTIEVQWNTLVCIYFSPIFKIKSSNSRRWTILMNAL